ncbi:MAG: hypothetical protein NZ898_01235 [Myxococcota bacterium]|nr:hypothetical protein [Myxococcota bacterium]MDW8360782.1 hypothetical protein [Myxococcales bacterium]
MSTFEALLVATPIWGLSLSIGGWSPPVAPTPRVLVASTSQATSASTAATTESDDASNEASSRGREGEEEPDAYEQALRERASLVSLHRPLGIATWAAMGITLLLGGFQYHDTYGTFSDLEDTPCTTGRGRILDQCVGTPWWHLTAALVTTVLYGGTFALALAMPDPDEGASDQSDFGRRLRLHKTLRWVHFGGMVLQMTLGFVVANGWRFGLDRATDYETLRALATVHMVSGMLTWGALTWAGALMVF